MQDYQDLQERLRKQDVKIFRRSGAVLEIPVTTLLPYFKERLKIKLSLTERPY